MAWTDLAQDYVDLAASYQGLGYLESGITEPLNRFAERMLDFSGLLKNLVGLPRAWYDRIRSRLISGQ
jgi:hypothetical protein